DYYCQSFDNNGFWVF
nr:immunoglobulin light chain junction region [Macaca mulatta]MOW59128.1 immunoglobulin light chain junction region [Macaca mulatta]